MARIETETTPVQEIQTELEILKWTGQIQSNVKNNVTSDAILAHLSDKQKEYVKEMTVNAYFIQNIINMLADRKKWKWQNGWVQEKADKQKIEKTAKLAFDSYMVQTDMEYILNRNTKRNWLVAQFAKAPPEPKEEEGTPQEPTKRIWDAITKKKGEETVEE